MTVDVKGKTAVVLIGHGAPATDCPPQFIGELMSLEWRDSSHAPGGVSGAASASRSHGHGSGSVSDRAAALDAKIRDWPRRPDNDPYKIGLERVAAALRPMLPQGLFAIGYNEFCRPSIPEAIEQVIGQGAMRVLVIPSMLTPGGIHSEVDIPRALDQMRAKYPAVLIEYIWPFDVAQVASLLAAHIRQVLK